SASADPVRAGRDLGVDVIVTGQVTDQERGLLIHGQLLRVADGIQLWAADYSNQTLSRLPASQQEMTADIVSRLPIRLSDKEREGLAKPLTRNREAEALMD